MKTLSLLPPGGLQNIAVQTVEDAPAPAGHEIRVQIHSTSLNFHDYLVAKGAIPMSGPRVLMSDGAGEVVAVGNEVEDLKPGDHVISLFYPNWIEGRPTTTKRIGVPGDRADGMATEYITLPATAVTRMPGEYSFEEAATLPCAALTAWRSLMVVGSVTPGDWVLVLGSGGVSIFALQFAHKLGARVIATTSSDEKAEKLKALGAEHVINYKSEPRWGEVAKELTGGVGVDEVIEVGGPETLAQSIAAVRLDGHIALVGVLTGREGLIPTAEFVRANVRMSGITVGSRQDQIEMVRAIEQMDIKPVIDSTFKMEDLAAAFEHQASQKHFGKIVASW